MKNKIQSMTEDLTKQHKNRKLWLRIITVISAIAVFCTTYTMILPAITWDLSLICEKPVHHHTAECYGTVTVPEEIGLTCGRQEHIHSDDCFELILTCVLEENEEHEHTAECCKRTLVCSEEEHVHSENCYSVTAEEHMESVLTCTIEEHTHTYACYDAPPAEKQMYFCGMTEHMHSGEALCYFEDGSLKCTLPEHVHTLACMSNPEAVESEARWALSYRNAVRTGSVAEDALAIAETQIGYRESDSNFITDGDGTVIVAGYTRYGDWYGILYGDPETDKYADWSAMFCSFCLNCANDGQYHIPVAKDCTSWIRRFTVHDLYRPADTDYKAKIGDVAFFDLDYDGVPDHAGLIYALTDDGYITVEGDIDDAVSTVVRSFSEVQIIGYAEIPSDLAALNKAETEEEIGTAEETEPAEKTENAENNDEAVDEITDADEPVPLVLSEIASEPAADGASAVVTGMLPEDAVVLIEAVELSADDLSSFIGASKANAATAYVAYDITIMSDGAEWQPGRDVKVTVKHPEITVTDEEMLAAVHIDSETNDVLSVTSELDENGDISFDTGGFSLYIFYTFTVDFHYADTTFSIEGQSSILLSELFAELGIQRDAKDVTALEFSDCSLIATAPVYADDGETVIDRLLISLKAFDTLETLDIWFGEDGLLEIGVTDDTSSEPGTTGDICYDKVGEAIEGHPGEYEVTLTVSGPGAAESGSTTPAQTIDTVLVLDTTSSLDSSELSQVKSAAAAFVNTVLVEGSSARVALVKFGDLDKSMILNSGLSGTNYYTYETKAAALSVINSLDNGSGYTGIQFGLVLAEDILKAPESQDSKKIVIMMTDGAPNLIYKLKKNGAPDGSSNYTLSYSAKPHSTSHTCAGTGATGAPTSTYLELYPNEATYNKYNYIGPGNLVYDRTQSCGVTSPSNIANSCSVTWVCADCTKSSGSSKKSGTSAIGGYQLTLYESTMLKQLTEDFYIVGVGVNNDNGIDIKKFMKQMATDEAHYYDIKSASQITDIFSGIATDIQKMATNATIVDPMGPDVGLMHTGDDASVTEIIENFVNGSADIYISAGELIYDPTTDTIRWEIGTVNFGELYTLKYKVKIDPGVTGNNIPLNDGATLSYDDLDGTPVEEELPLPEGEQVETNKTLTIMNSVAGVTTSQKFFFRATVADGAFAESADYTIESDGSVLFELANGESLALLVDPDKEVTITELNPDGFYVKFTATNGYQHSGASDTFTVSADRTVTVVNTAGADLPATGGNGSYFIYTFSAVLIAGTMVCGHLIRRKRKRRTE